VALDTRSARGSASHAAPVATITGGHASGARRTSVLAPAPAFNARLRRETLGLASRWRALRLTILNGMERLLE
jgi:hypothetical protein